MSWHTLKDFGSKLDFNAGDEWNLRDTEGAAGVRSFFAEDFHEEWGSPRREPAHGQRASEDPPAGQD